MKTIGEVKKVLAQYRNIKYMIDDLDGQIREVNERMYKIKNGNISGMPKGGRPVTLDDLVADKMYLEERKSKFVVVGNQKREIVQAYIDTVLSIRHNRFLTFYYIGGMSVYEIARKEHYSDRHAFRIFSESLDMVDITLNL